MLKKNIFNVRGRYFIIFTTIALHSGKGCGIIYFKIKTWIEDCFCIDQPVEKTMATTPAADECPKPGQHCCHNMGWNCPVLSLQLVSSSIALCLWYQYFWSNCIAFLDWPPNIYTPMLFSQWLVRGGFKMWKFVIKCQLLTPTFHIVHCNEIFTLYLVWNLNVKTQWKWALKYSH